MIKYIKTCLIGGVKVNIFNIKKLADLFSILATSLAVVLETSVSGQNSLDIARAAGADITEADNRWLAGTCNTKLN